MKNIFFLALIFINISINSQNLEGIYAGFKSDTELITSRPKVELKLDKKSNFKLSYHKHFVCSAHTDLNRICTGKYKKNGDTLILTSKYPMRKFYEIQSRQTKSDNKNIKLILALSDQIHLRGYSMRAKIDSTEIGSYKVGDTINIKKKPSSIELSYSCMYNMDWIINLENKKATNEYIIKLKNRVNNEGLSIKKMRFLITGNKLKILDKFYFIDIENNTLVKKL